MGCVSDGKSKIWEGSFRAAHLGVSLGVVRGMSLLWNAKELYWIAVYEVDADGVIDLQPALWQGLGPGNRGKYNKGPVPNELMLDKTTVPPSSYSLPATPKIVVKTYNDADWMQSTQFQKTYITISLKETDNDTLDRS